MKSVVILCLFFLTYAVVHAEGGKSRNASQILDSEGCVLSIPAGLEDDECEELTAPDQSGVRLFVCDDAKVTLICADDLSAEPAESPSVAKAKTKSAEAEFLSEPLVWLQIVKCA